MSGIDSDRAFRTALEALGTDRQRLVGALFVEHVLDLSDDPRVARALAVARESNVADGALDLARRSIKAASLEAHTRCGADGEWTEQAGYFAARAAEACLEPEGRSRSPAWKAAMHARMARTCLAADSEEDTHDSESRAQYQILSHYLGG